MLHYVFHFAVCMGATSPFGSREGEALSLEDSKQNPQKKQERPSCLFKPFPLPQKLRTALPQLVDVATEPTAERVYFVGLNQAQCSREPELQSGWKVGMATQFYGKSFTCTFFTEPNGPGKNFLVPLLRLCCTLSFLYVLPLSPCISQSSVRVKGNSTIVGSDADVVLFDCEIPKNLQQYARNTDKTAQLMVTVSHQEAQISTERPDDKWENLPVCANHIVNQGVLEKIPEKR